MSELKTIRGGDIHDDVEFVYDDEDRASVLYYLKSETDKVIAELKDKLQNVSSLLNETREWLVESQKLHKRCADNAVKVIRHHKYKRCLAMAEICCDKKENCYNRALRKYSKDEADYLARKSDFWQDWEFRWLKIAEKFKDARNV